MILGMRRLIKKKMKIYKGKIYIWKLLNFFTFNNSKDNKKIGIRDVRNMEIKKHSTIYFSRPQNSFFCYRKKLYRKNLGDLSKKLFSIDFIWSILLKYECFRLKSEIKLD